MSIKTKLIGAAAVAIVLCAGVAGVAGYASAQEPDGNENPRAERRAQFRERVAANLGVTVERLDQAFKDAALQGVADALAAGEITEEQAATMRERIESGEGPRQFRQRRHERMHRIRAAIIDSAATALGMTGEELRAELKAGKSIAAVAGKQGVSLDDVKAQITSDATTKLAELVASGKLTQAQADDALAKLAERLDDIVNRTRESAPSPQQ